MKILIIKSAALGDVLRTTSLLQPLKARYPGAKIAWITSLAAKPLLEGNSWIDRILTLPQAKRTIRKTFDLVLSMEEDLEAARVAQAACRGDLIGILQKKSTTGPAMGLGYTPSSARYYEMSLLNRDADGGLRTANQLKSANRLTYAELWLDMLKIPAPTTPGALRPILSLKPADRTAAKSLLRKNSLKRPVRAIGVNPGAGQRWPAKQLSEDRASSLLRALRDNFDVPILLFGGKDERVRNENIIKKSGDAAINAGTQHSLRSFAGLVDLCDLVVTTDSLALHIATALAKRAFVLIGPTSAAELDVFGTGKKLIPAQGCACFYQARCTQTNHCLDTITDETIINAIRENEHR